MKATILTWLVLAAPALAADDTAAIRELKLELWPRAYRDADPALLDRLLVPEFQSIDQRGVVTTKADELAYVKGKPKDPPGPRLNYRIERLEIFGTMALVTGIGELARATGPHRYRSTNVFVRRDGRWQALASHVSDVAAKP